ncbi:MAG: hypothetical protein KJP00_06430 [Bacteroidia bacterium]|nr:hypothetical protein [Bacteroidia bacterium]
MKKLIFLMIASLLFSIAQGQNQVEPELSREYYLQKSKNQKTVALGLLTGGAVMIIVSAATHKKGGSFICVTNSCEEPPNNDLSRIIGSAGLISSIASIPMFISAGINKRKAAELAYEYRSLKLDPILVNQDWEHAFVFRIALE